MITTRLVRPSDAQRVSKLLSVNASDRGGMLMGAWPVGTIDLRISERQRIVVAVDDRDRLLGVLLSSEKDSKRLRRYEPCSVRGRARTTPTCTVPSASPRKPGAG